jgi:hypothetical protein
MSVPLTRREHLNVHFFFIPVGTVIALGSGSSSLTVAEGAWPDNSPLTNWTDWEFEDIEKCLENKEIETETFTIPRASGGYRKDDEENIVKRTFTLTTSKTNAILKRLEHALASYIVSGTAQSPVGQKDNFILGVSLLEMQNKDGRVTERTQIWSKMRLVNPGEIGPATRKLEFSIEQLDSGNNTFVTIV